MSQVPDWTDEELKLLKDWSRSMNAHVLAERLNKPYNSVRSKLQALDRVGKVCQRIIRGELRDFVINEEGKYKIVEKQKVGRKATGKSPRKPAPYKSTGNPRGRPVTGRAVYKPVKREPVVIPTITRDMKQYKSVKLNDKTYKLVKIK